MDRKAFLAVLAGVPLAACQQTPSAREAAEAKAEQESDQTMLFTAVDLRNMIDVFGGVFFAQDKAIKGLRMRQKLWLKLLTFTAPENQESFKDAFLDDFLSDMPLIAYKYFIKGSDLDPNDISKLNEMVKRSIR